MPQIQVLPAVPGLGATLGQAIGDALNSGVASYQQQKSRTQLQKLFNPQPSQSNANDPSSPLGKLGLDQNGQPGAPGSKINPFAHNDVKNLIEKGYGKEAAQTFDKYTLEQQKLQEKEAMQVRGEQRKRQGDIVQKVQESNIGKRETLRKQKQDLTLGLKAVESGEVGGFDLNHIASLLGPAGEPFKNLSGVQLESSMKNLLLDGLTKAGSRPNQWIEQQLKSAMPSIGKKREANETLFAIALADVDIQEKMLDAQEELFNQYNSQGLTPPANIEKISADIVKPYSDMIDNRLAYDLRVIYEKAKGESYLNRMEKVPKGTPLTLEKRDALLTKFKGDKEKAIKEAHQLGYTIPDSNAVIRNGQ